MRMAYMEQHSMPPGSSSLPVSTTRLPCYWLLLARPSQPPLLSAMVRLVFEATDNKQLLRDALPLLIREHEYWTTGNKAIRVRAADGSIHALSRWGAQGCGVSS